MGILQTLLILVVAVPCGSVVANDVQSPTTILAEQQKEKRVEIDEQNLPQRILDDLEENYATTVFVRAFKYVDNDGNPTQYEVHVEQDEGRNMKLVYDKDGNPAEMIGNSLPEEEKN